MSKKKTTPRSVDSTAVYENVYFLEEDVSSDLLFSSIPGPFLNDPPPDPPVDQNTGDKNPESKGAKIKKKKP